ncbi:MAG: radical SAM protein [Candidatus Berkelbacteria bacterium]|nr:radical SAM protein [Candidatus Berkelbacteria bacterium]
MTFFIKILGCQYNEWDAARISFMLGQAGLVESTENEAEIIFILNCSVRKTGVDRALSFCRNYIKAGKTVIVTGCLLAPDRERFEKKGASLWDGEDNKAISEIIKFNIKTDSLTHIFADSLATSFIPIMKGCNNFCSYCAVPYTRGREVSRPMEEIIEDVKSLLSKGMKEITLLGQNVNSYKNQDSGLRIQDFLSSRVIENPLFEPELPQSRRPVGGLSETRDPITNTQKTAFTILLERINVIPGDFIINFTSNHPKDMTDEIIEAIATLPKVNKTIHLPLQSGSNKILKAMNRPYTKEQYLRLVEKMKLQIPDLILTTDTIVGFPGETEEDFEQTAEVLRIVQFKQAFNNKYSPREGTVAWKLGDPIPWAEKERRWRVLNDLVNKNQTNQSIL